MHYSTKRNEIYKPPPKPQIEKPATKDTTPAYIRNQQLKNKVLAMEKSVNDAIASHTSQSNYNVEQYSSFLESQEFLKNINTDLRRNKETTKTVYQEEIVKKNDRVTRLKLLYDLKYNNFKVYVCRRGAKRRAVRTPAGATIRHIRTPRRGHHTL